MRKLWKVLLLMVMLCSCSLNQKPAEEKLVFEQLNKLAEVDYDSLDKMIADKKTVIVYFGWVDNCGDSINFQKNYFEDFLKNHSDLIDGKIVLFNLDKIVPDALSNKDLRKPLTDKYTVAYSPTLIFIKDGVIVDKVEWTLKTSNPHTAIAKEDLDAFFEKTGLVK